MMYIFALGPTFMLFLTWVGEWYYWSGVSPLRRTKIKEFAVEDMQELLSRLAPSRKRLRMDGRESRGVDA